MKRALLLIVVLTLVSVSVALAVDLFQSHTATEYLRSVEAIKAAVEKKDMAGAHDLQAKVREGWERDVFWLNCFISHHHTRAVTEAFMALGTATRLGWQDEALKAIDRLECALTDIESGEICKWDNFL